MICNCGAEIVGTYTTAVLYGRGYDVRGELPTGALCCVLAHRSSLGLAELAARELERQPRYRMQHECSVAPGVRLVTYVVAAVDFHDDGQPFVNVEVTHDRLVAASGERVDGSEWPALREYMHGIRWRKLQPPGLAEAINVWCEELEARHALERAVGTEAPALNHDRDQREASL